MKQKVGGLHPNAIKVIQMDMEYKEIATFDSIADAIRATGCPYVCDACRKNVPKGGFRWKYG